MCKANSHTKDSNAKTLPNSCSKAARFVLENCGIHAEKSQYPCLKATIFMLEQHENHLQTPRNHAQELRNSYRNPTRMLSTPTESRADSASLLRIPNAQRARGVVFGNTEPVPRRASPRRATDPQTSKTTASIGVPAISQHHFTADTSIEPPERPAPLSRIASQSISGVTTSMDIAKYRLARPRHQPPSSHRKVAVCGAGQQLRITVAGRYRRLLSSNSAPPNRTTS